MGMSVFDYYGGHLRGDWRARAAQNIAPRARPEAVDAEFVEVTTPPLLGPPEDEPLRPAENDKGE